MMTVWTSYTLRGNDVERVTEGNVPVSPVFARHEIAHDTDTTPGHAAGRPVTPVRCRYEYTHAPEAAAWSFASFEGSNLEPAPAHAIDDADGSPGANCNAGVAVTVTHTAPAHPESVSVPVQFVTPTKTGTLMIEAVPIAGEAAIVG